MSAQPGFLLSPELLGKVRTTIARVDGDIPGRKSWTIPTRFEGEDGGGGGGGNVFRIATFTGAWAINDSKTVTFSNITNTPNTVSATNLFWPIPDGDERPCAIAKDGTAWYLLVPRLYQANAATAAIITTTAAEFKTLPVAALATSSTATFGLPITRCTT
jgi:hypothetical protein